MIERVVLKNFQKHRRLTVDLDPGVTVLVGPSDHGKSAVVRALRWAVLNKLASSPESYIRHGKSGMCVEVTCDGRLVSRRRGKKGNLYLLDGGVFKSFRDGVPHEIQSLLACDHDNFQRQADAQFWISESAGQMAKNLNAIVSLEVMDDAQAKAQKMLRDERAREAVCRERLHAAVLKKKELLWVVEANSLLKKTERLGERLAEKRSTIAQGAKLLETASTLRRARDRASEGLSRGLKVVSAGDAARLASKRAQTAREIVTGLVKARRDANIRVPDISPLLIMRKKADSLAERRRLAEELIREYEKQEKELCRIREELAAAEDSLKKLSRNRRCPACGRKLKSSPSSAPTSTCPTSHQSGGPPNPTGTRQWLGRSPSSTSNAASTTLRS